MPAHAQELNTQGGKNNPGPDLPDSKKSSKGSILAYFFLPGIIPQVKELGRGGFGYLAFLIAIVYQAVRILPMNHPYAKTENMGKFGIRQVIAAAANNVKLNRKNIDQVIIFFAILAGLVIMALQFVAIVLVMFSGEAWATGATGPDSFGGIFNTQYPDTDIAFHLMREVFGIPNLFGSPEGWSQTSFHKALQTLFRFYNLAILLVAVLVFLYYVIVVVAETAQTGTPFGKRFSHIYAPFRLVIAIGLLVPLNYGFNGAQYITFFAAKTGSGFASTGWIQFNNSVDNPLGTENAVLISETKPPDVEGLVEFMAMAVACREAYQIQESKTIEGMIPFKKKDGTTQFLPFEEGSYTTLENANNTQDIQIIFGKEKGSRGAGKTVIPYCGSVVVPITVPMGTSYVDADGFIDAKLTGSGTPGYLQKEYFSMVQKLWDDSALQQLGEATSKLHISHLKTDRTNYRPDPAIKETIISNYRVWVEYLVEQHYQNARDKVDFDMREETRKRGWGGAGIWYNRIAQVNGGYVVATFNIPIVNKFPKIAEFVLDQKKESDGSFEGCYAFEPNQADNKPTDFDEGGKDLAYARIFNDVHSYWTCGKSKNASNFFLDAASAIFGLQGLLDIREKAEGTGGEEVNVHPLAKLSALGRGLVESATRNMGFAVASSFTGGMLSVLGPQLGASLEAASSMFVSIATIGLSIGFITYYILPFLPFMYFFFAVGGWVKSIFEAMVGAPLWALAHLRIDGDGIPGKMAMNGYVLILEIFLRPILTVFGLLGGMAIFIALAMILNEVFDLVVINAGGPDLKEKGDSQFSRHIVDVFFFTCVYAVILYMMAIASFKMINLVPNNILRWLGQSVSSFSDQTDDPTQGLVQYAALGGARIGGQLAGGVTQLSKAGGSGIGAVFGLGGANKTPKA